MDKKVILNSWEEQLTEDDKIILGREMNEFMATPLYQKIQSYLLAEAHRLESEMMEPKIFAPNETELLMGQQIGVKRLSRMFKRKVKVTDRIKHILRGKWQVFTYYFSHEFPLWVKTGKRIEGNRREDREETGGENV